ncbi:MAG TPA: C39 family peptidase [Archangium sp.]|uniref:C39 family peptidase n=1 Tax=Archangium sp. TaxID=1872627 RepID=UPI002EDA4E92
MSLNEILFSHTTTGASAVTAKQDDLKVAGVKASQQMARTDLPKLQPYAEAFITVGKKYGLPPALLAAISSRETRGGSQLKKSGFGANGADFGLMQINKDSHKLVGGPFSREHIDQAGDILSSFFKQVKSKHPTWAKAQQLRGAVAAYNFGVSNVRTLEGMDRGTANHDYSSDVWARAQTLAPHFDVAGGTVAGSTHKPTSTTGGSTSVVTTPGSRGAQDNQVVKELQALLVRYGYMTDKQVKTGVGILGPQTQAALSQFLADNKKGAPSSTSGTGSTTPKEKPKQDVFPTKSVVELEGVPLYGQADEPWGPLFLGKANDLRIRTAGCAMTATSMAISKISGRVIDPKQLDEYLDGHGGYSGNGLNWLVAAQSRGLKATYPYPTWSLATVDKELAEGRPVVVGVHYKDGSKGGRWGTDHWVTITGKSLKGTSPVYSAHDPANGRKFHFTVDGTRLRTTTKTGAASNYVTTGELRTFFQPQPKSRAA